MVVLQEIFKQLLLTPNHTKVYLACLQLGNSGASTIAAQAKVARSSCYQLLNDLKKLGLVSEIQTEAKKLFSPAPPDVLQYLISQHQKLLEVSASTLTKSLPELESLYQSHQPQFPTVRFYQGESGLKTVYYDALSAPEILIICQGSSTTQASLATDPPYLRDFIRECTLRPIPTRELLQNTPAARQYQQKYQSSSHQIIITPPASRLPLLKIGHVDKHLYADKIAFINHDDLVGVIITSKTLFQSEKQLFETLWQYYKIKDNKDNHGS